MVNYQTLMAARCLLSMLNSDNQRVSQAEWQHMEAMARIRAEQALLRAKQQQAYSYGWHDPLATQQRYALDKWEPIEDLNKKLWNIKPIKFRPIPILLLFSFALVCIAILIKVKGIA